MVNNLLYVDVSFWIYLVVLLVCLYSTGLFIWWWKRIGRATEVYAYMTFLFVGIGISSGIGLYARLLHSCVGCDEYHEFITSIWWGIGPLVVLAVLVLISIRMTIRVVRTYYYESGFRLDRRNDKVHEYPPCPKCKRGEKEEK